MSVRSYYCAVCGIKLTPEQAQYGRPSAESLTTYCPTCAEEKGIECVRDAPPLSTTSSGRFSAVSGSGKSSSSSSRSSRSSSSRSDSSNRVGPASDGEGQGIGPDGLPSLPAPPV